MFNLTSLWLLLILGLSRHPFFHAPWPLYNGPDVWAKNEQSPIVFPQAHGTEVNYCSSGSEC